MQRRQVFSLLDKKDKMKLVIIFVIMIISGLTEALGVVSVFPFILVATNPDDFYNNENVQWLNSVFGIGTMQEFLIFSGFGTILLISLSMFVKLLAGYSVQRFAAMREFQITIRILALYLRQPYTWFLERHSSSIARTILSEISQIIGQTMVPMLRIASQIPVILCIVAILIIASPLVSVVMATIIGSLYAIISLAFRRPLADISKKIFETNRQRFRLSNEMLGGIKELKIMHLEQEYVNRFSTPSYILATTKPRSFIYNMSPRFILEAALYGGIVGTVIVLILVFDGRIEAYLPTVGLFGLATVRLLPAAQSLYYDLNRVRLNEAVFERVFQDLEAARRVEDSEPPVVTPLAQTEPIGLQHGIVFDSVDYSYPSASRGALNGLSLVIPAHSTVGIVGGTGAGKTTTVDLLLGLLTPQRGTIRLDDTVLDGTSLPAWRASIGYVPQQIFLGDESVAANIAFGVPRHEIDHAAVERAARIAELHDFIVDTLPDGYDTQVGERGVRLSGGQRQRIGIARALYRNPDVLILDEATSALDNITESRVMKSIQQMAGQKTIIMIAHRLTTVQNCDVIFLLENGRLAAQGGFEELKRRSPAFAAMVTSSEQGDTAPVDAVAASG